MALYQRRSIISQLKKGPVKVTFTKQNGRKRVITATLQEDVVPVYDGEPGGPNKDVVACYDLKEKAWRSFRVDSVQNIEAA